MWSRSASFAAVVGTCLLLSVHDVLAISKLSAVGSKFFNEEGQQFFVKGIIYSGHHHLIGELILIFREKELRTSSLLKTPLWTRNSAN